MRIQKIALITLRELIFAGTNFREVFFIREIINFREWAKFLSKIRVFLLQNG